MSINIEKINDYAGRDPRDLLAVCDVSLDRKYAKAAAAIATSQKPIVLLSGPSGSGKTTSAGKIQRALTRIGIKAYVVSMDDYFRTFHSETHPRDEHGQIDYESPYCVDYELLKIHSDLLANGQEIEVPCFDFYTSSRSVEPSMLIKLRKGEVVIFEGIHALNPIMFDHDERINRVYASARSHFNNNNGVYFKSTWVRLLRRIIRDDNFRGKTADQTLALWASIRRGEKKFITPYKNLADISIDTTLPYELCAMRKVGLRLLEQSKLEYCERNDEIQMFRPRLEMITPIEEHMVSCKSLLREFIGLNSNKTQI